MTKTQAFRIKNTLLSANLVSNLFGVLIVFFLIRRLYYPVDPSVLQITNHVNNFFSPISFLLIAILTVWYELPIRRYVDLMAKNEKIPPDVTIKAQQRLLNEPFFLITLDSIIWILAAIVFSTLYWWIGLGWEVIQRPLIMNTITGMITVTVAFFVFEFHLQKILVPYFFPEGGLNAVPKTIRIRIGTRLFAVLLACNVTPLVAILSLFSGLSQDAKDPIQILQNLRFSTFLLAFMFMGTSTYLIMLVNKTLSKPFKEIIQVLHEIRNGKLDKQVRVTSNDEIGYTGDVINDMIAGLQERDMIKDIFGKHVSKDVRDAILSGNIPLDGEKKIVTALFCDLRNFTTLVEKYDPKLIIKIMNNYFKEMDEAIQGNEGLVMQFIGDEIYAAFGAPISLSGHPSKAFRAGLEMNKRLAELNNKFENYGWPKLQHGIGIHTGEALAVIIGSPKRGTYSLVGDNINIASRLQSLTKKFDCTMILSENTYRELDDKDRVLAEFIKLPPTMIKGKERKMGIYCTKNSSFSSKNRKTVR